MTYVKKALVQSNSTAVCKDIIRFWKKDLEIHKETEWAHAITEEELSCKTWAGCTSKKFQEHKEKYRRANDNVIETVHILNSTVKLVRVFQWDNGNLVGKIIRDEHQRYALKGYERSMKMSGTYMKKALNTAGQHQLDRNPITELIGTYEEAIGGELPWKGSEEDKKKLLQHLGKAIADTMTQPNPTREEILDGLLGRFDEKEKQGKMLPLSGDKFYDAIKKLRDDKQQIEDKSGCKSE